MQSVTIEGYLGRDPQLLAARTDGRKRAVFSVGETTRFRKADGSDGERTTWFDCVCFDEARSENYIGAYARKGSRVVIHGRVKENRWTDRDGVEHYDQQLVVGDIRISNRREAGERSGEMAEPLAEAASPARSRARRAKADPKPPVREVFPVDLDDEIPF